MHTTRSIVDVHLLDTMLLLFLLLDLRFDIAHSISLLPSVHRLFTTLACCVVHSRPPLLLYAKVVQQRFGCPFFYTPVPCVQLVVRLEAGKGLLPLLIRGCISG